MNAWCYGAAGMALARAARLAPHRRSGVRGGGGTRARGDRSGAAVDGRAPLLRQSRSRRSDAHGGAVAWRRAARRAQPAARRRCSAPMLRRGHVALSSSGFTYVVSRPGFFQGLSGVGYHFLRQASPDATAVGAGVRAAATRPGDDIVKGASCPHCRLSASTEAQASGLARMTFPAYRHLLALEPVPRHPDEGDLRPVQPIAIGASARRRDCRARAGRGPGSPAIAGSATLLSVFVDDVVPAAGNRHGTRRGASKPRWPGAAMRVSVWCT